MPLYYMENVLSYSVFCFLELQTIHVDSTLFLHSSCLMNIKNKIKAKQHKQKQNILVLLLKILLSRVLIIRHLRLEFSMSLLLSARVIQCSGKQKTWLKIIQPSQGSLMASFRIAILLTIGANVLTALGLWTQSENQQYKLYFLHGVTNLR